MTIRDALRAGSRILADAQIRTVEQDTRLLLQSATGLSLAQILAHPETVLPSDQEDRFTQLVRRRAGSYPVQYLVGEQEFYGRSFMVSPDVLIPRPETELLVERAIAQMKSLEQEEIRVVDVGTGSGCVSVTLALEDPRTRVTATDISEAALKVARANAVRHGCLERIEFLAGDTLEPVRDRLGYFSLIVSNPPYVSVDSDQVDVSVALYEPHQAVFAGPSGLEIYFKIFEQARALLSPGGSLILELGYGALSGVRAAGEQFGWTLEAVAEDLAGIDRCAVFSRS